MPITRNEDPVYKLICSNTDCDHEDWTALGEDDEIKYFDSEQHARHWGSDNGWQVNGTILCPGDAAEARERREQDEDIALAVREALEGM